MLQKIRNSFEKFRVQTWDWFSIFFLALLAWFLTSLVIGSIFLKGNEANTGNVGDTIGGITAPFIGLLNAILVYMAFKQQSLANQMQFKAIQDEQKRFIKSSQFESMLLFKDHLEKDRIKSRYDTQPLGFIQSSPYYGSQAVLWFCHDTLQQPEVPRFYSRLNDMQKLLLKQEIEKYTAYLKTVHNWFIRLRSARISRFEKEMLLLSLIAVAPLDELQLASNRMCENIFEKDSKLLKEIQDRENKINEIANRYTIKQ